MKTRQLDTTHDLEKTRDLCFKLDTGKEAVRSVTVRTLTYCSLTQSRSSQCQSAVFVHVFVRQVQQELESCRSELELLRKHLALERERIKQTAQLSGEACRDPASQR